MQTSNLECICEEGMRATCSSNEVSILPTAVALLLAWLGFRYFAGDQSDDEEAGGETSTMYS